ncbi:MAG: FxsA family protein [Polyangiaceae bacterium]|nr:FxsA family protein [Polyangiaceae bacterium]MBK8943460.1 FxsA family protein [Polyangiaceae bacterium]
MGYLFLLFAILPIVEIWLLLLIGGAIGFWPTVGLTIATAIVGGYLTKREGLRVLEQWRRAMGELRMPEDGLVSGVLVLVGGVLLATPGVLSDLLGLFLLFPPTRKLVAPFVSRWAMAKITRAAETGRLTVRVSSSFGGVGAASGVEPDEEIQVRDVERKAADRPRLGTGD